MASRRGSGIPAAGRRSAGAHEDLRLRIDGTPVTMDLGLLYAALDSRQVDMIAANSTDGQAAVRDVTILGRRSPLFSALRLRGGGARGALARYPGLRSALEQLPAKSRRRPCGGSISRWMANIIRRRRRRGVSGLARGEIMCAGSQNSANLSGRRKNSIQLRTRRGIR
jgi:hypothetical protein